MSCRTFFETGLRDEFANIPAKISPLKHARWHYSQHLYQGIKRFLHCNASKLDEAPLLVEARTLPVGTMSG